MVFKIATASSAKSTSWKNRSYSWDELTEKLTKATVTDETYREFMSASKAEQGNIKDVGAFMGGELFGSRRNKNNVGERSILALDIDYGERTSRKRSTRLSIARVSVTVRTNITQRQTRSVTVLSSHCPNQWTGNNTKLSPERLQN